MPVEAPQAGNSIGSGTGYPKADRVQAAEPGERRVHAIAQVILDSGARIDEILSLRRQDIDLDNLLLKLQGKGSKQRLVPISPAGRKILYLWMAAHDYDLVSAPNAVLNWAKGTYCGTTS
jgi:integrase/recombinase XerD